MIKHTQTIRRQQLMICLSAFDHFVGLVLKRLLSQSEGYLGLCQTIINFFMHNVQNGQA